MDSGLDYELDYGLDYGLNFGLDFGLESIMYELTLCFTVQFLIASSLVPKVMIIRTFMHFFQRIWKRLKPSQSIDSEHIRSGKMLYL